MEKNIPIITRVANYLFLEICAAYGAGDQELETYYQGGLDLAEKIEKESTGEQEKETTKINCEIAAFK